MREREKRERDREQRKKEVVEEEDSTFKTYQALSETILIL
jgi:hypothetical protein